MAQNGAALWRRLELDAWANIKTADRGPRPDQRIADSWAAIASRPVKRNALVASILELQAVQADIINNPLSDEMRVADDAAVVDQWLADARAALPLRTRLADLGTEIYEQIQDMFSQKECVDTEDYLAQMSIDEDKIVDTLKARIATIEKRRAALNDDDDDTSMDGASSDEEENRMSFGRLSSQWFDQGSAGSGGNDKYIQTFVKVVAGKIVDRVIIKEETEDWGEQSLWDSTTIPGRNLRTEIASMLRVRGGNGSDKIVELRNWRTNDSAGTARNRPTKYRLYLEYCGFGDLNKLRSSPPAFIPEPYMWKIFEDLVIACTLLDRESIIHRDFKMENGTT
ncbi:uncharacterized protein RCC_10992 [Ramularia collo-cygni]|uniref:Protein kinase domain-containing protein n=1 Tax=Ramularia collo-cygni TaxID=112498 RepID=A0A2D3VPZ9_9PEZI|nr:uncharacterized protein RCC_10992 [Ramularia collo-cygni]CZT25264.1 uncharacterized protein RCC_10992 [Ramularia collo-cygni]